jgi:hypothetical protein
MRASALSAHIPPEYCDVGVSAKRLGILGGQILIEVREELVAIEAAEGGQNAVRAPGHQIRWL